MSYAVEAAELTPTVEEFIKDSRPDESLLNLAADYLDDIERLRISTANRIFALREKKNLGGTPEVERWESQLDQIEAIEKFAIRELERAMKAHPLGEFVAKTPGLGLKQVARLLAAMGPLEDRPNVAKAWAYAGLHVIDGKAPKRRKGQQANWSGEARKRAYLVATSIVKVMHSPYRAVYDRERAKWADREGVTDAHRHMHALRVVAKEVLKDLWVESRKQAGLPHWKNRPGDADD